MTQPFTEKCDAIRSLLPLLVAHLALMPGARLVPAYGDSPVEPATPTPPWRLLQCNGVCHTCEYQRDCKGEAWEAEALKLTKKYRLNVLRGALMRLENAAPQLFEAVCQVYVEPLDLPSADDWQVRWADAGVRWLARSTRGEFVAEWGEVRPKSRQEQIAEMTQDGLHTGAIAGRLGCSCRYVRRVKATLEIRQECTPSAVG